MQSSRTYYMILGVSSTETDQGIRAAYRDLAKRLHPDVAGEQSTRSFQELSEAYGVLSDPQRRREYNREIERAEDGGVVAERRSPPEPLMREGLACLTFEVLLTPEEALRGCVVPVGITGFTRLLIRIPPRVPSGSIYEIPLRDMGIHDRFVRLHVFVEARPG